MAVDPIGTTALLVLVPDAEPVVGRWRDRYDRGAAMGVPAHVTVVYPWQVDPDEDTVAALGQLFGARPAFEIDFGRVARFPDVLYLEPDSPGPLVALTHAVVQRWPDLPPYSGKYGPDPEPHLTITASASVAEQSEVEAAVARALPLHTTADAVTLLRYDGERWRIMQRFLLGIGNE